MIGKMFHENLWTTPSCQRHLQDRTIACRSLGGNAEAHSKMHLFCWIASLLSCSSRRLVRTDQLANSCAHHRALFTIFILASKRSASCCGPRVTGIIALSRSDLELPCSIKDSKYSAACLGGHRSCRVQARVGRPIGRSRQGG